MIDERIALPRERAPDQYVPWGHNGHLKLFSGQDTLGMGKAKPFEQWSVDEVFRLIKSIGGLDESAEAIKVNRINGKYFADMLRNNDEDLTKSIADDGLGFKKLQLKVVKAKIEETQGADS